MPIPASARSTTGELMTEPQQTPLADRHGTLAVERRAQHQGAISTQRPVSNNQRALDIRCQGRQSRHGGAQRPRGGKKPPAVHAGTA